MLFENYIFTLNEFFLKIYIDGFVSISWYSWYYDFLTLIFFFVVVIIFIIIVIYILLYINFYYYYMELKKWLWERIEEDWKGLKSIFF